MGGGKKEHDVEENQRQASPETFCRWSWREQQVCSPTFLMFRGLTCCEQMSALNVLCVLFILSVRALKGEMGKDTEILAPVGITVTTDEGKILGMSNASQHQIS